jgi:hypothetical protein
VIDEVVTVVKQMILLCHKEDMAIDKANINANADLLLELN